MMQSHQGPRFHFNACGPLITFVGAGKYTMGQMQEEQYSTKTGVGVHAHEAPMVSSCSKFRLLPSHCFMARWFVLASVVAV